MSPAQHEGVGLSPEARATLERFATVDRSAWKQAPKDASGWKTLQGFVEVSMEPMVREALERFEGTVDEVRLGELPALRLAPGDGQASTPPMAFVHGGGYTVHSARSTLPGALALARTLRRTVYSLDYPLAPDATVGRTVPLVSGALAALIDAQGSCPVAGDSAGGGLALAAVSDLARQERTLPSHLGLISPWTDLTDTGDSRELVRGRDPVLSWEPMLAASAEAYAGKHPERPDASPVYAEHTPGFPPTLVLCGTREILLSDSLRLHDRLERVGVRTALRLYDGLFHSFPMVAPDLPESEDARRRLREFFDGQWPEPAARTGDVTRPGHRPA